MTNHPQLTPLAVDLDGTLIKTDSSLEDFIWCCRFPTLVLSILLKHRKRAAIKKALHAVSPMEVSNLPYDQRVIEALKEERAKGREIVLVTGSDQARADAVSAHLGLFDGAHGSIPPVNLVAHEKARLLEEKYGNQFCYAGNSSADLKVWPKGSSAWIVNAPKAVLRKARQQTAIEREIPAPSTGEDIKSTLKALRPHQWSKNLLLFVPLVTSHGFLDARALLMCFLGFIAFSLCASAVYVVNDLLDLEADRRHPDKKKRPFAAGTVPVPTGLAAALLCLIASLGIAWGLSPNFFGILIVYLLVTSAYSIHIKTLALADVLCLGALYTSRIFAGSALLGIQVSSWLLAFSMFFFISLAFAKRVAELLVLADAKSAKASGRDYTPADIPVLSQIGIGCSVLSVLVLALYITHPMVVLLYNYPNRLWLALPLLLFWLARIWLLTSRGQMQSDPVLFAIKDRTSYGIGVITLIIGLWAV